MVVDRSWLKVRQKISSFMPSVGRSRNKINCCEATRVKHFKVSCELQTGTMSVRRKGRTLLSRVSLSTHNGSLGNQVALREKSKTGESTAISACVACKSNDYIPKQSIKFNTWESTANERFLSYAYSCVIKYFSKVYSFSRYPETRGS